MTASPHHLSRQSGAALLIAMTLLPSYYDVPMEEGSIAAAIASGAVDAGIL